MQKKIIALAIAGLSSAAFAQSNVTISGNLDMGYQNASLKSTNTATLRDNSSIAGNGSSTSNISFSGSEALGGGMKVNFLIGTDFGGAGNVGVTGAAAGAAVANTWMTGQSYLELAGNFGSLKAGNINSAIMTAALTAQPFGTALGGGYSGNFARLSLTGTNGAYATAVEGETTAGNSGTRLVRNNNSLYYTSPSFSGFTATLGVAFKNDSGTVAANATDTPRYTEVGLAYNNGPLNVAFANTSVSAGSVAGTAAGIAANEKITHNALGANYTFGPATVYAGWTRSKQTNDPVVNADSASWNIALKYAISGNLALMGNVLRVNDKRVNDQDRSLTGLGLDYSMSKRTTAYVRYETGDNDRSGVTGTGATDGGFTRYAVGMRHTF